MTPDSDPKQSASSEGVVILERLRERPAEENLIHYGISRRGWMVPMQRTEPERVVMLLFYPSQRSEGCYGAGNGNQGGTAGV